VLILLVDDDPRVRASWRRIVEADGHEVREAGSVQDAMTVLVDVKAHGLSFDAALIDYELGTGLTGVDVGEHTDQRTALLMVTGHDPSIMQPVIERPLRRFLAVLGKPLDAQQLRNVLAHVQRRNDPTR
jgi:DNA-binding NtrC family response regulator